MHYTPKCPRLSSMVCALVAAALFACGNSGQDALFSAAAGASGTDTGAGAGSTQAAGGEATQNGTDGVSGAAASPSSGSGSQPSGPVAGDVFSVLDRGPGPLAFAVQPGTRGLPGTGVAGEAVNPESSLYISSNTGPAEVAGSNGVYLKPDEVGLVAGDALDGFAILKNVPVAPLYYFSVQNLATFETEGQASTQVRRSAAQSLEPEAQPPEDPASKEPATEIPGAEELAADIFQARPPDAGKASNALWTDEQRLGLEARFTSEELTSKLSALEIEVPTQPSRVFFSVTKTAAGKAQSGVATTAAGERGCTVFESLRDGTNKVLATCAQLGLAAGDELDALAVFGEGDDLEIWFSVDEASNGAAGSAVREQRAGGHAADIFRSELDDTNTLKVDHLALGLGPDAVSARDDLTGLAVVDTEPQTRFAFENDACAPLVPSPYCDADTDTAEKWTVQTSAYVADDVFLVVRQNRQTQATQLTAYDAKTRQRLAGEANLQSNGFVTGAVVALPQAGWARSAPFATLDVWLIAQFATSDVPARALQHFTGDGGPPKQNIRLPNVPSPRNMLYLPASDQFAVASDAAVTYLPKPKAGSDNIVQSEVESLPLPAPCQLPDVFGFDPISGGLEYTSRIDPDQRVCELTSDLYFRSPPATYTRPFVASQLERGFVVLDKDTTKNHMIALSTSSQRKGCPTLARVCTARATP